MLGRRLCWRGEELFADDPLSAWQGLLRVRGLSEADGFFTPRLADLPDPDGMCDMLRASERLASAAANGESVHVFGDFDADGVCGTAILVEALRAAGATLTGARSGRGRMPARHQRGYGYHVL